jgi:hypothetical protein
MARPLGERPGRVRTIDHSQEAELLASIARGLERDGRVSGIDRAPVERPPLVSVALE